MKRSVKEILRDESGIGVVEVILILLVLVGLVDDDILLRGKMIGGIRVDGPHMEAKRIVAETRADSVVIACELEPERLKAVVDSFKRCGVKVSYFGFSERVI